MDTMLADSRMCTKLIVNGSPRTSSLDEGFESDPDNLPNSNNTNNTNNSNNNHNNSREFDLLQRTDDDGVQHTQITRRHSSSSTDQSNIICYNGTNSSNIDIDKNLKETSPTSVTIPRAVTTQSSNANTTVTTTPLSNTTQSTVISGNSHKPERYRRIKPRAPSPPIRNNNLLLPAGARTQSVDRICGISGNNGPASVDILFGGTRGDILSGKLVRVTVDARSQRLMLPSTYYPAGGGPCGNSVNNNNNGVNSHNNISSSNSSNNINNNIQIWPPVHNNGSMKGYNNRHVIGQIPVCWTQSIPRQTRKFVYFIIYKSKISFLIFFFKYLLPVML